MYIEIYEYALLNQHGSWLIFFFEADNISMGIGKSISKIDSCKLMDTEDLKSTMGISVEHSHIVTQCLCCASTYCCGYTASCTIYITLSWSSIHVRGP